MLLKYAPNGCLFRFENSGRFALKVGDKYLLLNTSDDFKLLASECREYYAERLGEGEYEEAVVIIANDFADKIITPIRKALDGKNSK